MSHKPAPEQSELSPRLNLTQLQVHILEHMLRNAQGKKLSVRFADPADDVKNMRAIEYYAGEADILAYLLNLDQVLAAQAAEAAEAAKSPPPSDETTF